MFAAGSQNFHPAGLARRGVLSSRYLHRKGAPLASRCELSEEDEYAKILYRDNAGCLSDSPSSG
jgi:hypothetical protein